jgi:small subunit ribosomal protein S29e
MTTSNPKKMLKQLNKKPGKKAKYLKHNLPKKRKFGQSTKKCQICGRTHAHINKYGINMCRQCFRLNALKLGFKKYR